MLPKPTQSFSRMGRSTYNAISSAVRSGIEGCPVARPPGLPSFCWRGWHWHSLEAEGIWGISIVADKTLGSGQSIQRLRGLQFLIARDNMIAEGDKSIGVFDRIGGGCVNADIVRSVALTSPLAGGKQWVRVCS